MKTAVTFLMALLSLAVKGDGWVRKADAPTISKRGAISFSIGKKAFVATGADNNTNIYKDLWQYDVNTNLWTQKADFSGDARGWAVSFVIDNKGYLGTGFTSIPLNKYFKDFWEYDTLTNIWTKKADFPGSARSSGVGLSIGNHGYMGLGNDGSFSHNDFWEYNTNSDSWTRKADYPGQGTWAVFSFSIGTKGYIGAGFAITPVKDFWEYNSFTDSWNQKSDFGGSSRVGAVGFSIGSRGYAGTGYNLSYLKDFWEYDVPTNKWIQKTDFPGNARALACAFATLNRGYLGIGSNQDTADLWEYTPDSTTAVNDLSPSFSFTLSPNPVHQSLLINYQSSTNNKIELTIIDVNGSPPAPQRGVKSLSLGGVGQAVIDISGLASGVYFLVAEDEKGRVVKKFLKE